MNTNTEHKEAPSYGLLTAEQVLSYFDIKLDINALTKTINNPEDIYSRLLYLPFKNIYNGIIYQQIHDYQVYVQKLFIDYLLSGQGELSADVAGSQTRDAIEVKRKELITMDESFNKLENEHKKLIADSQKDLIKISSKSHATGTSNNTKSTFRGLSAETIEEIIKKYDNLITDMNVKLKDIRNIYKDFTTQVIALLNALPDYKIDEVKDLQNRSAIEFNTNIDL